jgi:hypothetical protein
MTIRSTDILSLPPYTYLSRPALTEALYLLVHERVDRTRNMARYLVACLAYYVRIGILRKQEQPT